MGDQIKLDQNGTCPSCNVVTTTKENTTCTMCKAVFHSSCEATDADNKPGTKSLINLFNGPSTKSNFKFFCDVCATNFEIEQASSEDKRLNVVEKNVDTIKKELEEIKNLLKHPVSTNTKTTRTDNVWFDQKRLASIKFPTAKPLLVVSNAQASSGSIEKAIVDNSIPVTKSYTNASGDLVLECDSSDTREKLKTVVESTSETLQLKMSTGKKPSITIVGLTLQYSKDEIISQIVSQNQFVKFFSTVNNINEHIEIHDIKPTRAKPTVYQAFASVSEALRKGFSNYKDKVTIGIQTCKIYDRFHIRRCNNCQGLGHYYKDCPTPNIPCCAKCSGNHRTDACESNQKKCTNCTKNDIENTNHTTYDPNCPSMMKLVDKKRKSYTEHLNSMNTTMAHL